MRSARPTRSSAVSTRSRRSRLRQRREQQRQLHVLEGVEHRHQVVELEDEAHVGGAPVGELAFAQPRDVLAVHEQRAGVGLVDAGDEVEQRRLARARRTHQRDEVALGDVERDVAQHRHDLVAAPVALRRGADLDDRARGHVGVTSSRPSTVAPSRSFSGGLNAPPCRRPSRPPTCIRSPSFVAAPTATSFTTFLSSTTSTTLLSPRLTTASGRTAVTGLRSSAFGRARQEGHLGAHVGQHARVALHERDLHQDRGLGAVHRRHDARDFAQQAQVGIGVELDLGGHADLDLGDRGFGDVGLDFERVHVGHVHHRALGVRRPRRTA